MLDQSLLDESLRYVPRPALRYARGHWSLTYSVDIDGRVMHALLAAA